MVIVRKTRSGLTKKQAASFLAGLPDENKPVDAVKSATLPQKKRRKQRCFIYHRHDWTVLLEPALVEGQEAALIPGQDNFPENRKLPTLIAQVHNWARQHGIVISTRTTKKPTPRVLVKILGKTKVK